MQMALKLVIKIRIKIKIPNSVACAIKDFNFTTATLFKVPSYYVASSSILVF